MKIRCRYCDSMISDTCERCPNCGAANIDMIRGGSSKPVAIKELQDFCREKNIPLSKMRFFIGENRKEPKCFGIYEENGRFIVYKNKSDGTRAIRYEGPDEAYAVAQIYDKLKEEVDKRNLPKQGTSGNTVRRGQNEFRFVHFTMIMVIMIMLSMFVAMLPRIRITHSSRGLYPGYYSYDDECYYYDGDDYYLYDDYHDAWYYYSRPLNLDNSYRMDYSEAYEAFYDNPYIGYDYDTDNGYDDYWSNYWYGEEEAASYGDDGWHIEWDSDWNSGSSWSTDSSWDSDWSSWDSGGTDWDSDW